MANRSPLGRKAVPGNGLLLAEENKKKRKRGGEEELSRNCTLASLAAAANTPHKIVAGMALARLS